MQLQQSNVVIQCLAVVIVMDVCGGDTQCLRSRAAVFAGQIVVADTDVNRIS